MNENERLRLLRGQLEDDYQFIVESSLRHTDMVSRSTRTTDDEMATMAIAYLLHNLYTAFEGYFLRIAKHFENSIDDSAWHRELIERMKIDVSGIRPAVITADLTEPLDELRRFRHLFRNLYKSYLKQHRVKEVSGLAESLVDRFTPCHQRFVTWIDELIQSEE